MILTDAGPLVALGDARESRHADCREALSALKGPILTTLPCLTEAIHILRARAGWKPQEALLTLAARGVIKIAELTHSDLERCRALMTRYRNVPMSFPDATLVVTAEKNKLTRIFTLDSDFRIYRVGRRAFQITP